MSTPRAWRALAAPLAVFLFVSLVVLGFLPWRCPLHALAGIPCPTCGISRAVRLALHGDLRAATRMHPLWLPVLLASVGGVAAETLGYARAGRWGTALERRWVMAGLGLVGIALVLVWIARFLGAFGGPLA